jgi:hypothetical protein
MTLTSMKSLLSLAAVAATALSIATATPAEAGGGGGFASPSSKFMQKNGMQMHANTRQRATKQMAADRSVFSDASTGTPLVYDLQPTGTGIARRRWVRD